jgi:anti-anti-sigma regulatory factor
MSEQGPETENGDKQMSATAAIRETSTTSGECQLSTKVTAGVAMVTVSGPLGPSAMPSCRATLDAILRLRAPRVEVDLSRAWLDPESITMLIWMHRYVGHFGVSLTLTGVGHVVAQILERDHLDGVFKIRPTDRAQRRAVARAEHRDQWPTPVHPPTLPSTGPDRQDRA